MFSFLGLIITSALGKLFPYLHQRSQQQHAVDIAGIMATKDSWKDDIITYIVLSPVVILFWGTFRGNDELVASVGRAFEELALLPTWYQTMLQAVVYAGIGLYAVAKSGKILTRHASDKLAQRDPTKAKQIADNVSSILKG